MSFPFRTFRLRLLIALVSVLSTLLVARIASASIPSANGVIHGCFSTQTHVLRVIDAFHTACKSDEKVLTWNQQGPKGDKGPRGKRGALGDTGATGPQGPVGPQGAKGDTGAQGPQGVQGAQGPQGVPGLPGLPGQKGDTGARGPAGLTWRGDWNSGATYQPYDAVSYNGSSWVATALSIANPPSLGNPTWSLLAAKGDTGAPGVPGVGGTTSFAVITATGTLDRGKNVIGTSRSAAGLYRVTFNANVSACSYQATLGASTGGFATGFISATRDPTNSQTVLVRVLAKDGTTAQDSPFHLGVFC